MLDKLLKNISYSFRRYFNQTDKYTSVFQTGTTPEEPLKRNILVVIGTENTVKWLYFLCPCGCGAELKLPLMASFRARWQIVLHSNLTLTVDPSVDVKSPGCGAHFWIRNNNVFWAEQKPSIFSHWF